MNKNDALIKLKNIDKDLLILQDELKKLDHNLSDIYTSIENIQDITILVKKTFTAYKEIVDQLHSVSK